MSYRVTRAAASVAGDDAADEDRGGAGRRGGEALKIGEVSRLSGVGVEALRFYERSGLLEHPRRTEGGYRTYGEEALERLAFIKRAQALGFTLAEIKHLVAEKQAGRSPCAEVRELVRARLKELDERMSQMRRYRKELAGLLSDWEAGGEVEGHVCGLIEGAGEVHPPEAHGGAQRRADKRKKQ